MPHPSKSAVGDASLASSRNPAVDPAGDFVINLCASTSPMALARPSSPELARFTFFVSRRREDGRERFRLHMGYFQTRDEAEQMLLLVRDVYPAAWVGDTPGKRLKPAGAAPAATAAAAAAVTAVIPAAHAATAAPVAPVVRSAAVAPVAEPFPLFDDAASATRQMPSPQLPPAAAPAAASAPLSAPISPAAAPQVTRRVAAPAAATPARTVAPAATAANAGSNVREVLADLGHRNPQDVARDAGVPAIKSLSPGADLTDSQILKVLEQRSPAARGDAAVGPARDISLLSPEDTQTWHEIKTQLKRDATVYFAVQLEWSVSEIELTRIPGLAIFNAYTLYKIEGSREGRKWYGLRLGFFSDAVSAKQVAYYVRSEFAQVAVVPVSTGERAQAREIGAIELPRAAPTAGGPSGRTAHETITLIDDRPPLPAPPVVQPAAAAAQPSARGRAAPGKTAKRRPERPRGSPQTLEETLEILGASQLSIDVGRGERMVLDNAPRKKSSQASTFSKLLDRLSEKLRK